MLNFYFFPLFSFVFPLLFLCFFFMFFFFSVCSFCYVFGFWFGSVFVGVSFVTFLVCFGLGIGFLVSLFVFRSSGFGLDWGFCCFFVWFRGFCMFLLVWASCCFFNLLPGFTDQMVPKGLFRVSFDVFAAATPLLLG